MKTPLLEHLQSWMEAGALRALDLAFARFLAQQIQPVEESLLLAAALVSERQGHGHVCLDLKACLQHPEQLLSLTRAQHPEEIHRQLSEYLDNMTLDTWVQTLQASEAVDSAWQPGAAEQTAPLVLAGSPDQPLLYLRRYWQYEQTIQQALQQRLKRVRSLPPEAKRLIQQLFPETNQAPRPDWQKLACVLAARSDFAIITGGPGTGKTTTVVRLLALLQGLQLTRGEAFLQIKLAAPTGKAAARLNESLLKNLQALNLPGEQSDVWRASLPREVTTLHRLLGSQPGTRQFRHQASNPLAADLVVVDEASMVDVEMMACLLQALRPDARLILLGDKDQLASVEAGSILGDLCRDAEAGHYSQTTRQALYQLTGEEPLDPATGKSLVDDQGSPLHQATAMLRHSFRFSQYPGIGELAQLVNQGSAGSGAFKQVFEKDAQRSEKSLHFLSIRDQKDPDFLKLVTQGYRPYLELVASRPAGAFDDHLSLNAWASEVFKRHQKFQLLTALRQGDWGVEGLNQTLYQALRSTAIGRQLLPEGEPLWYPGRPVLMTRNDYGLQLMNGDIGICLELPAEQPGQPPLLRVAFPDPNKGVRWVLPSRLQDVETVFAMTVHKSQGSEFQHTALVLPPVSSPILTKELLYTGITRSSQTFTLVASETRVLNQLLHKRIDRASGLDLQTPAGANG
ncbi:DNA helicase/exodeoxyribonuclease V, alpha subunit [Marinospirillum celere]|uniref:RecBCD enzyme subunit RecD n=1 Tax=Marinospirillum celere TaxID=1122252 RepID=A0A1I1EKP5_9GAMM|nr:exodeoxyribonuclease V subunit alpha [Marinospirillum celere]SFB87641.1 DNA helicase/exodeoxyribonuclease V, alpha subunit [Marinospirillum celere]